MLPDPLNGRTPSKPCSTISLGMACRSFRRRWLKDEAAAVAAARALGGRVVLKIASTDIQHKSDIGGVALNLEGDDAVADAFRRVMAAAPAGARVDGVLVSPMRERGLELFVGCTRDPQWGPVLAVGLGGVFVEVLQDVALRVLPVTAAEVRRMLARVERRQDAGGATRRSRG